MITAATRRHAMQCMEIWGGNHATDHCVTTPGLEMWISSRPFGGAAGGGDVHYLSLCGGGSISRILLADVAGHGAAVADLARSLRGLMRRNINRKNAARLMQSLNGEFGNLADHQRFATAVVATYLTKGDRLTICNAGHPRPLMYSSESQSWAFANCDAAGSNVLTGLPLGIDDSTCYSTIELQLARGDRVLLYTDALTESTSPSGEVLGESGLLELVRDLDRCEPAEMGTALIEALDRFRGCDAPEDDQTIVLLHHTAAHPPRLGIRQSLDVYAKLLHLKRV